MVYGTAAILPTDLDYGHHMSKPTMRRSQKKQDRMLYRLGEARELLVLLYVHFCCEVLLVLVSVLPTSFFLSDILRAMLRYSFTCLEVIPQTNLSP